MIHLHHKFRLKGWGSRTADRQTKPVWWPSRKTAKKGTLMHHMLRDNHPPEPKLLATSSPPCSASNPKDRDVYSQCSGTAPTRIYSSPVVPDQLPVSSCSTQIAHGTAPYLLCRSAQALTNGRNYANGSTYNGPVKIACRQPYSSRPMEIGLGWLHWRYHLRDNVICLLQTNRERHYLTRGILLLSSISGRGRDMGPTILT